MLSIDDCHGTKSGRLWQNHGDNVHIDDCDRTNVTTYIMPTVTTRIHIGDIDRNIMTTYILASDIGRNKTEIKIFRGNFLEIVW